MTSIKIENTIQHPYFVTFRRKLIILLLSICIILCMVNVFFFLNLNILNNALNIKHNIMKRNYLLLSQSNINLMTMVRCSFNFHYRFKIPKYYLIIEKLLISVYHKLILLIYCLLVNIIKLLYMANVLE